MGERFMREREAPASFVQITESVADIDELPEHWFMAGARRCDLHGHSWIKLTTITDERVAMAGVKHRRIHHVQASPYSQSGCHDRRHGRQ
ncbi:hypothetical protein KRR38_32625 [Novosphingobium sp. G106]|uniref:hypothetical protein n=1 Tax=Novosphingobium sp. G106 TaxID=2849500 RepID=UPI001C2CCAD9|nr:hypothetical protein [Novosphingobium sp. G106]MBV1692280.1 hypothetical protein [Novosphingobium sp. G106]